MSAAGAAARTAATTAERQFRLDHEAHIAHVDLNATDALKKGAFEAESETVGFEGFVVFSRLIQSQCETRAASATGGKINTDAGLGLIGEESLKLSTSRVGNLDHDVLQVYCLAKNRNGSELCQWKERAVFHFFRRKMPASHPVQARAAFSRAKPSSKSRFRSSTSSRPMA